MIRRKRQNSKRGDDRTITFDEYPIVYRLHETTTRCIVKYERLTTLNTGKVYCLEGCTIRLILTWNETVWC